ncbi:tyrosine-protein kinase Dnt [Ixodes scapularis]|uniref:tyrosine-protein kinase Dnt n=1 Tax=Ixodes scapularis TaxID=6945 RepID=UPI001C380EDB|nr:tyrosine-protein kinase Dnt [Ixodes scapularis]
MAAAALAAAATLTVLGVVTASSKTAFNLYLKQHESRRLFGLDVELYYVKEGRRNEYALGFVVPVPANVSELEFVWQGLGPVPLAYALDVQVAEGKGHGALARPSLDVDPTGTLPSAPRAFRVRLPCTGQASAEVPVRIVLNVSQENNATSVSVPRKKICARSEPWRRDVAAPSGPSVSAAPRPLVVAAGCACAAVAAAALAATASWMVRARKARTALGTPGPEDAASWQQAWPDGPLEDSPVPPWNTAALPESPTPPLRLGACSRAGSTVGAVSRCSSPCPAAPALAERLAEIAVERHKVTLLETLHQGTFGQVHHGLLIEDWAEVGTEQNVIVKTVTRE